MRKLKIVWQRLVSDNRTCPRCGSTERELERSVKKLKKAFALLNIDVDLKKKKIGKAAFERDPMQSNILLIEGKPIEYWLSADVGQSPCCDTCGDEECRTLESEGRVYETIPEKLIIKACLIAAGKMIK